MRAAPALIALLLLAGCGAGGDEDDSAAPPAPAVKPTAAAPDPKAEWLNAMTGLCGTLGGEVSGLTLQASTSDNQITPDEHADIAIRAKPATDTFDAAVAALPVPPEAGPVKKAFDDFLALQKTAYAQLDAAAKAKDQAALTKAYGVIQGQYATTPEGMALKASGLAEKCNFRGTYPQT